MNTQFILAIVRHILGALATWLVTQGYLQQGTTEQFVGAVLFVGTLVWSVINKMRNEKAIDTALNLPEFSTREILAKELKK